jgi:hypothetical protein
MNWQTLGLLVLHQTKESADGAHPQAAIQQEQTADLFAEDRKVHGVQVRNFNVGLTREGGTGANRQNSQ